jgi:hypothetical protein
MDVRWLAPELLDVAEIPSYFPPAQDRTSLPTLPGVRQSAQMRPLAYFALGDI